MANSLQFVAPLHDNTDEMMFASVTLGTLASAGLPGTRILSSDLVRINVRTGGTTPDVKDPEHVQKWFINARGQVLAGWQDWEKEWVLWWRKSPTDRWQTTRMPKKQEHPEFLPIAVAPDGQRLLALDYRRSNGVDFVYYDPATGERENVVGNVSSVPTRVESWGFDETPGVVRYEGEAVKAKYLNPAAEALMQTLQKTLPGLTVELVNFSHDNSRAVVLAMGERITGEYLVVECATGQIVRIGAQRAQMTRDRTFPRKFFEFKASDGLPITGVVTLPGGNQKAPVVLFMDSQIRSRVLPNNPIVHYFASLGYAVAEVNYRGIDGFGSDFRAAGLFQQEKAIPRDLSEALAYLEAQGLADSSRVVIYCSGIRALPAFALAAQSKAVKAVLAVDPWTLIERADARVLEHSDRLEIDLVRMAGPSFGYQTHRKNADPSDNAVKAGIPVFAYYGDTKWVARSRDRVLAVPDSGFTSAIKKASKQTEIFKASEVLKELGYGNSTEMVDWKVSGRAMEHAVAFLHQLGLP